MSEEEKKECEEHLNKFVFTLMAKLTTPPYGKQRACTIHNNTTTFEILKESTKDAIVAGVLGAVMRMQPETKKTNTTPSAN